MIRPLSTKKLNTNKPLSKKARVTGYSKDKKDLSESDSPAEKRDISKSKKSLNDIFSKLLSNVV